MTSSYKVTTVEPAIDATDLQYQADLEFKPDKEAGWPFPFHKDGWVLVHNALRGEMVLVKETLQAVQARQQSASWALQEWHVAAIQKATKGHFTNISQHHKNEDDILVPAIRARAKYPNKLADDHQQLMEKIAQVEKIVAALKPGDAIDELLQIWVEYESKMLPHFREEEEMGLPLFRAYFTQAEAKVIIKKILAKCPRVEIGSIIYFTGADTFRNEFMKQEGIPGFVWYLDFKGSLNIFVDNVILPLEAVRNDKEPQSETSCAIL